MNFIPTRKTIKGLAFAYAKRLLGSGEKDFVKDNVKQLKKPWARNLLRIPDLVQSTIPFVITGIIRPSPTERFIRENQEMNPSAHQLFQCCFESLPEGLGIENETDFLQQSLYAETGRSDEL